jgi:uncharacterized protein YggE
MSALPLSRVFVLFAVALVFATASVVADQPVRKVTVVGNATIKVVPDEMRFTAQVYITDATLEKAKERHDAALTSALGFIKGLGGAVKDLQTGGIRIDKNMYPGDNPDARKNPFTCSTQFTFTLIDFDKYGAIADGLSKIDGIQIQQVDYASSKEDGTKREALNKALLNAHDKANDLAATAGCYIDKPLEILEGTPNDGPRPMMMMARAMPMSVGTPAAVPGQIEISASVTATYDLFYK